jgi:hypothetical protein
MYKEKQEQLYSRINSIIANTDYRIFKEAVGTELRKRGLDSSIIILASEIIMKNAKVEQLVNEEDNDIKLLFFFADALNKALSDNEGAIIILENYFLKSEIEELTDYTIKEGKESIFPLTIYDVTQFNDHHWEGSITAQYQDKCNSYRVPYYNPNTQRNPKRTKKGDKINVDPKKVLAIRDELLSGEYETDSIIWNILKTGDEKFTYNPKNRTLTIFEGSIINIVDGQHRKEANSAAIAINPNLDYKWPLSIFNVSEIKAHSIMVQKNKQTKMPEEWIQTKDYSRYENDVISKMKDEKSNLFKIMGEDEKQIANNQSLVKKSNIALAIKEIYQEEISDNDDRRQLARWLSEFFDYMIKLYSYEFIEESLKVKEVSFINWKNMFFGYIALSRALRNKDNWREVFKEKMSSIDFSNTNPLWQTFGILNTKDANATLRKHLYNLFKEGVE